MLEFLETKIQYSFRKLGPAERNNLYVGPGQNMTVDEFNGEEIYSNAVPNEDKGGVKLTNYLTYNCLSINEDGQDDIYMSSLRTFWTCDICQLHLPLTFQEKTQHRRVTILKSKWGFIFHNN
jgi:hypothetical protein